MLFRFNNADLNKAYARGGFTSVTDMGSYALLNLVWSVFILTTPLFEGPSHFPNWVLPTLSSYVVFLWLYFRLFFRKESESVIGYAMVIALLGYLVMPFNPGAQGYLIYACAFFAFAPTVRDAIRLMAGMLTLFAVEWYFLGFPWQYSL